MTTSFFPLTKAWKITKLRNYLKKYYPILQLIIRESEILGFRVIPTYQEWRETASKSKAPEAWSQLTPRQRDCANLLPTKTEDFQCKFVNSFHRRCWWRSYNNWVKELLLFDSKKDTFTNWLFIREHCCYMLAFTWGWSWILAFKLHISVPMVSIYIKCNTYLHIHLFICSQLEAILMTLWVSVYSIEAWLSRLSKKFFSENITRAFICSGIIYFFRISQDSGNLTSYYLR